MGMDRQEKRVAPDISAMVSAALREAGWTPDRRGRTSTYREAYAAEGLEFLPKAESFLRRFGGLVVRYETLSHQEDVLEFLAERAVQGMGGGIACFEELIGTAPLCPIGQYLFGTCMLLMDRKGQVFGGSDTTVTLIGGTGEQAIENILGGAESVVLDPADERVRRP